MEGKKLLTWLIVAVLVINLGGFYMLNNKSVEVEPFTVPPAALSEEDKADIVNGVLNNLPEPTVVEGDSGSDSPLTSNEKLDSLCDLTDGCDGYEIKGSDKSDAVDAVEAYLDANNEKKLKRLLANLLEMDEDYLVIDDFDVKDSEVKAANEEDKDDEEYTAKLFARVKYHDEDSSTGDKEVVYVLISSSVEDGDEVDNAEMTLSERTFEF